MKPATALLLALTLNAASPTAWESSSYTDFVRGRFAGVSLSRDGRLMLAPTLEAVFASGQPVVWALAYSRDGTLYVATGHSGKLFRVDPDGKGALLWTAEQPEIFALATDDRGRLYAGTSPNGKVYRIENGKASEFFAPGARYIWALHFGRDGALYVGTGDEGLIYRVDSGGRGEIFYDTGQSHVTSLAVDSQGRLLAGTDPNGILYRVEGKDRGFVLYDSALQEIRAIVPSPDGVVYAAALAGTAARGATATTPASGAGSNQVTAPATTITVTAEGSAQSGVEIKPKPAEQAKPVTPQVTSTLTPAPELYGLDKAAVYRIQADNTVETLWTSKDENLYDIVQIRDHLLLSTDGGGRIYRLTPDRRLTLLAQSQEGEATRLLFDGNRIYGGVMGQGKLFRFGQGWSSAGVYESPVHDAGSVARWGRLSANVEACDGCRVQFRTRSGNSSRPDRTWSEWQEPQNGGTVASPNARYIQWKAELKGTGSGSPVISGVSLAYLPQNNPPVVKTITVATQVAATAPKVTQPPAANQAYSITVTDTGEAGVTTSAGTPTQNLARAVTQNLNIVWQAEDPDNDRMAYTVYFRGEGERSWKVLKQAISENSISLETDMLADSRYLFRVVASDKPSNSSATAREAELVSAPVLVDFTAPQVKASAPQREGKTVRIALEATDAASPIRRLEYSLDTGFWTPIDPTDGVLDSLREQAMVVIDELGPGEHLLVIRAYDAAGNAGLARVVIQ